MHRMILLSEICQIKGTAQNMNVMSRHGTSFHAHAANFWCLWWSISSQKSLPKYHPGWIWQMHTNAWRFEDSWPFYPNFFYPNFSNYCGKMVKQTSLSTFQDTHSPLHPTGFTTPPPTADSDRCCPSWVSRPLKTNHVPMLASGLAMLSSR